MKYDVFAVLVIQRYAPQALLQALEGHCCLDGRHGAAAQTANFDDGRIQSMYSAIEDLAKETVQTVNEKKKKQE